ncbi:MAG: manganese efflux pump [Bacteroidales bacterium]|nr:manganese efflux pump [Bacteroidales bacterium]
MIFHSIILFLGIKRTVRFFTVKRDARSFQLIHIFDVAGVATAVAIDAMIFGLGLGMVQEHPLNTLFLLAAITLVMGVFGVAVKRKMSVKDNGALVELLSGVILVVISIYILIN